MRTRIVLLTVIIALTSGCYLPSNFTADLQIDRSGRYRFTYTGELTDLSMVRRISRDNLEGIPLQKRIELTKRDLRRDKSFKNIQHMGKARFRVSYQRDGNIIAEKSFNFISPNSRLLTLKYNKNTDEITMIGGRPNEKQANALKKLGFKFQGTLRVWTNSRPKKFNAKNIEPRGQLLVYSWHLERVLQPVPYFVFKPTFLK